MSKVITINLNKKDYLHDHISYFMNNVIILIKIWHSYQNNETNIIKMKDQIQIKIRKYIYWFFNYLNGQKSSYHSKRGNTNRNIFKTFNDCVYNLSFWYILYLVVKSTIELEGHLGHLHNHLFCFDMQSKV